MDVLLESHTIHAMGILVGAVLVAVLAETVLMRLASRITRRTKNEVDDKIVAAVRVPLVLSIVAVGAWYALVHVHPAEATEQTARNVLLTIAVLAWTLAGIRIAGVVVDALVKQPGQAGLVQVTTRPLIAMAFKVVVLGTGLYFLFLTWKIDVTAWLASAGIVGIAMGFAAQDSLANLFAGLSILADRPFVVGDFLVLNGDTRGRVTSIGLRSTRVRSTDHTWLGHLATISFGSAHSLASTGTGPEAFGLGRRRVSRTVVADTNTPSTHSVIAIRCRPHIGFLPKMSQISCAISRGVLLTGSAAGRRPPSLPSWKALSQR